MRSSSRAGSVLLVSAAAASTSGALVAAIPPWASGDAGIAFAPLLSILVGTIVAGHLLKRALLVYALLPLLFMGSAVTFVTTSGVLPPGSVVAAVLLLTTGILPFDATSARIILSAVALGGAAAVASFALRTVEGYPALALAVFVNVVALVAYLLAAIMCSRRWLPRWERPTGTSSPAAFTKPDNPVVERLPSSTRGSKAEGS